MAHPTKESLQPKRYQAHLIGTTYVYDFPELFFKALHNLKIKARATDSSLSSPKITLEVKDLVLDEHDKLAEVGRAPGTNTFGMVAWVFTLRTPEYPSRRKVVVIANNITYKIGTQYLRVNEVSQTRLLHRLITLTPTLILTKTTSPPTTNPFPPPPVVLRHKTCSNCAKLTR
jgi:hypothetical protein